MTFLPLLVAEEKGFFSAEGVSAYCVQVQTHGGQTLAQLVDSGEVGFLTSLTNAMEAGDGASALKQLALLIDAGTPPEKILGQLAWLVRTKFAGIAPGALARAVGALFRTDQALKRSGGDPRVLLERLVVELCGPRR
jgi:DNA polymerase III delta subunit